MVNMLNWIEIDDQTQQRMMEVKRLYETGFYEEVLRDPYEEYLEQANDLLNKVNNREITTEQYSWEIQLLMNQYSDCINRRRERLKENAR